MPSYAILSQKTLENGKIAYTAVFKCDDGHEETQRYIGTDEKVLEAACKHMNDERKVQSEPVDLNGADLEFVEVK